MGRRYLASAAVMLAAFSTLAFSGQVFAQQSKANQQVNQGNGLRISPVRHDVTIEPGKGQTVDVYVENISGSTAELKGVVNDFVASEDESGKPRVLFDEKDSAPSHGLKNYVAPIQVFRLQPGEQKVVKVTVNIPADAAGGGYYGAVRFLPTNTTSDKNVSLSASVGSLILVTVPGDVKEQLGIIGFNVSRGGGDKAKASSFFTSGKDLQLNMRFKNSGNVQASPFGKVILKKGGKEVASYEVNNIQPRGSILPDSVRRFEQKLGDKADGLGKYTLEGNFGYGAGGQLLTGKTTFYVVPTLFVVLGIILVAALLIAIFALPRMIKGRDRKLARKMRGR